MFSCALCEIEWVFGQNVCAQCRQIRHLMNIYSKESVLKCLNKCLVIERFKEDKDKESPADEDISQTDKSYNKPTLRSANK
tara:strand:+ start:283 stop:525 length:243 start_codon:yes stop_codon:yes gene_type:complete